MSLNNFHNYISRCVKKYSVNDLYSEFSKTSQPL